MNTLIVEIFLAALITGYFVGVIVRIGYVERPPGPRRTRPSLELHASRLPSTLPTVIVQEDEVELLPDSPPARSSSIPPPLPARARSTFPAMRYRDKMETLPKIDLALIERSKKETLS